MVGVGQWFTTGFKWWLVSFIGLIIMCLPALIVYIVKPVMPVVGWALAGVFFILYFAVIGWLLWTFRKFLYK